MRDKFSGGNLWAAVALALLIPILVLAYFDNPPSAATGWAPPPGYVGPLLPEGTCFECHNLPTGSKLNGFSGKVVITITSGPSTLATSYSSGDTYNITVTDFDSAQKRWGFELSARTEGGKPAGTIQAGSGNCNADGSGGCTQILAAPPPPLDQIQYIGHTLSGTRPGTRDTGSGVSFKFSWTAPDTSFGPVYFNAAGNAANNDGTDMGDHIYTTQLILSPAGWPALNVNGTVNNASFAPGTSPLAPGMIAAVFGSNLNDGSSNPSSSFGGNGKLLTTLGGASVTFIASNGATFSTFSAPIFSSFPGQLNVQIPAELAGATSAAAVVMVGGHASAPQPMPIGPSSPGIFAINNQGTGQGAIQIANTTIFAAPSGSIPGAQAQPAKPGDIITIYCTGLGAVMNAPATGAPASSSSLSDTLTTPQVMIGGLPATVSFSGLSPGFVGLYQINAQVPAAAASGSAVPVVVTIGNSQSNTVTIAIAGP